MCLCCEDERRWIGENRLIDLQSETVCGSAGIVYYGGHGVGRYKQCSGRKEE